jgi:hypothetical protein
MKTIVITGTREEVHAGKVAEQLSKLTPGEALIIHGDAHGVDTEADNVCTALGLDHIKFYANWKHYGKAAGPIRNRKMLDMKPDEVWAFPVPHSIGTRDCMNEAARRGIIVKDFS